MKLDIYIKPVKKVSLAGRSQVLVKDVAEVIATADVAEKVRGMKLLTIEADGEKKKNYLVSVTDIIKAIKKTYPNCTVNNVGAQDTVVQYALEKSHDNPWWKWAKIAFVVVVLLAGSATAIMTFHTDAQVPKVFENYYRIFYGQYENNPWIINIPYAIGMAVGILVFFNHFAGKKITDDPTPIEVEMSLYETEVNETVLDVLNTQKANEGQHGNN
jgi:stage V sporulation protein AA